MGKMTENEGLKVLVRLSTSNLGVSIYAQISENDLNFAQWTNSMINKIFANKFPNFWVIVVAKLNSRQVLGLRLFFFLYFLKYRGGETLLIFFGKIQIPRKYYSPKIIAYSTKKKFVSSLQIHRIG